MSHSLLVIEDDPVLREAMRLRLQHGGWEVLVAGSVAEARRLLTVSIVDVALMDLYLPDGTAFDLVPEIRTRPDPPEFILVTSERDTRVSVRAIKEGAYDYVLKPIDFDELTAIIERARLVAQARRVVERERSALRGAMSLIGEDPKMVALRHQVRRLAQSSCETLLITGETGTGKQLVAQAFHHESLRATRPLVQLNVAALPVTLIESELFGFEKGAFTDARHPRRGLFEDADNGTLFLDEIGELDMALQPKLLRVLEERKIRRLGSNKEISVSVRVVTATNRNLDGLVSDGRFRADLLYRLDVARVEIPPLRDRAADIVPLARSFLFGFAGAQGRKIEGFTGAAEEALFCHEWPGNVRELRNAVERSLFNYTGTLVDADDLQLRKAARICPADSRPVARNNAPLPLPEPAAPPAVKDGVVLPLDEFERQYVQRVVEWCEGNKSEAARRLGISRMTLREKLRESAEVA